MKYERYHLNVPHYERDDLSIGEIFEALVTGTLPVFFQEGPDDYIWGIGTLFMVQWGAHQFAVTAKHVIDNQQANVKHLRVLIPGYKVALPLKRISTANHPNHECKDEVEDILVFEIEQEFELDDDRLVWYTWKMKEFWAPANKLKPGDRLYAVGYPHIPERYDYDLNKIRVPPLIAIGKLSEESIGRDIYTIECDNFDYELNGISGGPVFTRIDGLFHYVGLIIRAGKDARRIHFVNSTYVNFIFNQIEKGL